MIVEVTFWIAVVVATRKLGKVYAKSGDVLYGSYISDNLAGAVRNAVGIRYGVSRVT
jgi:hypothetical protein